MHDDHTLYVEGIEHGAKLTYRRRLRRVDPAWNEWILLCIAEDVNVGVAGTSGHGKTHLRSWLRRLGSQSVCFPKQSSGPSQNASRNSLSSRDPVHMRCAPEVTVS
jgi:ABC-type glutathione transport system ATPase component